MQNKSMALAEVLRMRLFQRKEIAECFAASDAQDTIETNRNVCKAVLASFETMVTLNH